MRPKVLIACIVWGLIFEKCSKPEANLTQNETSINTSDSLSDMSDEQLDSLELESVRYLFLDPSNRRERENNLLVNYALDHHLPLSYDERGFYVSVHKKGNGPSIKWGDWVAVHYTGRFLDGKVFDASRERNKPLEFRVGNMIPGFNFGLMHLTHGGEETILLPSDLAYGEDGFERIPPNTPLVFEIQVVDHHPSDDQ